ncbi:hypothetical protein F3Y22_tig00111390pilonHSYRG00043 [Hibiscus syriacus]|uniref:Transposase MuDR plant domain-containing protein n=1 Tax=Hibiscus syriacus TaxID=106335 RepID=A0A6A2YM44_HIBSY|nr:hypothetical protein F3Y22_tig00111390pilonHSYRG00043 [Hibiscus syriacus]
MLRVLPSDHNIHIYLEGIERLNEHNQDWSEHNEPEIDEAEPVEPEISEPEINEPEPAESEINEPELVELEINKPEPAEPEINEPEINEPEPAEPEINEPEIDEPEPVEVRIDSEYEAPQISSDESDFSGSDNDFENSKLELCDLNTEVESDEMKVVSDSEDGNSDSLYSVDESDGDGSHKKPRHPEFNTTTDITNLKLKIGLIFINKKILRAAIRMYAIKNRYNVKFRRNDNTRIQVRCKAGFPWVLWASPLAPKDPSDGTSQIKSLNDEHTCLKGFENANITAKWITKHYFQSFHVDPNYYVKSLKQDMRNDYGIMVSTSKCSRAKFIALEKLHGNHTEQYTKLYDYLNELRDFWGHLLAVVGVDADHSIYPLAFAVGLVEAVAELYPNTEHRTCVRHLYSNFKSNGHHKEKALNDQLWMVARATYVREFEYFMEGMKLLSRTSHKWLSEKDPKMWSKSHFSFKAKSDILLNNLCPNQWTPIETMESILPPTLRRPPGRPHKNRRREADEAPPYTRVYNVRCIPTSIVPLSQDSCVTQSSPHQQAPTLNQAAMQNQSTSPKAQSPSQGYTVRWMPTPTVHIRQQTFLSQSSPKRHKSDTSSSQPSPQN